MQITIPPASSSIPPISIDATDKKIVYIDASSLKSDSLCDRRYLLHIVRGHSLSNRASNYKAGYGTALHAGLQEYYSVSPPARHAAMPLVKEKILEVWNKYAPYADPDDFRTADHLLTVMDKYHERYQRGDSIVPLPGMMESKFCLPWFESNELIIYLTGTIDLISDYFGRIIIVDHKSTGCPTHKIPEFFRTFEMNIQTQLYVYVFKQLSKMATYVPIMINGIFIKRCTQKEEKAGEFDGVHFERTQLIEYTDEQMAEFEHWLKSKLIRIQTLIEHYVLPNPILTEPMQLGPTNYAACNAGFSLCPYFEVCQQPPDLQLSILKSKYIVEPYNPLTFND